MRFTRTLVVLCVLQSGPATASNPDSRDRSTAVALNYCRASFHRIKRTPTTVVLFEEREKILNNLNINAINDEEVLRLYTAVLEEIGQVQIADRERAACKKHYKQLIRRQIGASVFAFGSQVATAQFVGAVRSGVNSWWDYRNLDWSRGQDLWKVDRARVQALVDKSSRFLDTFWKLAQKKNIPDRWLVRGADLDRLADALREPDPEIRLRMLKRMERFLECYPPYLYYLARTQQALGQLFAAANTYDELADLGIGHFRKDDMLAAGLANRAVIQEYLGQTSSVETAREALAFSSSVWGANLLCVGVLERHGHVDEAEEALLRNLDDDLEQEQSRTQQLGLYRRTKNFDKLRRALGKPETVSTVPLPVLLACAVDLPGSAIDGPLHKHLMASLSVAVRPRLGADEVLVSAGQCWRIESATLEFQTPAYRFRDPNVKTVEGNTVLRFRDRTDAIGKWRHGGGRLSARLRLQYPQFPTMLIELREPIQAADGMMIGAIGLMRRRALRPAGIQIGEKRVTLPPVAVTASQPQTAAE